jgi:D-psicose/D-tagatose/L-ribulose 3-epimerase
MVRIGMHTSLWAPSWTAEAAETFVPEAAKWGLDVLEIPVLQPETIDAEHAARLLKENGVEATVSLCLPPDQMAQTNPDAAEAFLMRALEVAQRLGADFLGGVTYSALGFRSGSPPTEEEYANIARALKPVARRAREAGMRLGLEPCNRYETHLLNTAEQSLAMLDRIGEDNVTIHLDTYHMNIEEKGIGHGLRLAGDRCSYLHVSESDRGVPGTGTIDWNDTFRTLAEIGFQGDLVMESFVTLPPEIAAALSVWRPVASGKDEVLEKGVPFIQSLARVHGLTGDARQA